MKSKIMAIAGLGLVLAGQVFSTPVLADESGVPLHGFADIIAGSSGPDTPEEQKLRGFSMGNVDFYLNPEFGPKVKALFEIALEPGAADGVIAPDVERTQLGYVINDENTLWVGRFHTPYGAWNTAFHHGGQLMTTVYRPRFIDFEDKGGVLPAHSVGSWLHGAAKVSNDKIIYDIYSVNGPRIVTDGTSGTLDYNLMKADRQGSTTGFNLAYRFGGGDLDGLQIGLHGYAGTVNSYNGSTYGSGAYLNSTDVRMTGGYVFYEGDKFEFDGEYYRFDNKDKSTTTSSSDTMTSSLYFAELGVPIGSWKPFVLYEMAVLNAADNYFLQQANAMSYTRSSAGVRYDLDAVSTVKFEILATKSTAPTDISYTTWVTQYAVRF